MAIIIALMTYLIFNCVYVSACDYVHASAAVQGCQSIHIPLELELQVVANHPIWVPGTEVRSSERAISALNC